MGYKWKPSAAAKREFAERMKDPAEVAAYQERKSARAAIRRSKSAFDYATAGGEYVPTQAQHDFVMSNIGLFSDPDKKEACNAVLYGYSCKEKIHHDFIHVVNDVMRGCLNIVL